MNGPESTLDRARRRGTRLGILAFGAFVATFTAVWSWQILFQAFGPPPPGKPRSDCRTAVLALLSAVERARVEAVQADDERSALARFRRALEPAWSDRPLLEAACAGDEAALRALPQIDEFRFAEEHAVRRDFDLSRDRQRARLLHQQLSSARPDEPPRR